MPAQWASPALENIDYFGASAQPSDLAAAVLILWEASNI